MSSTDKQGSSLGSFPTSPPLYPHFNRPSGFWPCVKSCLVGGSDKYSASPRLARTYLSVSGGLPPGFYLPREGWVYCPTPEAPQKGNADGTEGIFGTCRMRVGYGPAPGPTIKRPCAILARSVGRATYTASSALANFELILRSQGAFCPGFYLPQEGWVYCPTPEAPQKGNADRTDGIFGTCRMRVGYGPAPGPTIKRPCAILARSVGRATNTASSALALCPVVGRTRPAVVASRTVRSGVFHHWIYHLWPSEGLGLSPGAPKRGMPTGSEAFLELPAALGFGPAIGPTLKRPCAIFVRWWGVG